LLDSALASTLVPQLWFQSDPQEPQPSPYHHAGADVTLDTRPGGLVALNVRLKGRVIDVTVVHCCRLLGHSVTVGVTVTTRLQDPTSCQSKRALSHVGTLTPRNQRVRSPGLCPSTTAATNRARTAHGNIIALLNQLPETNGRSSGSSQPRQRETCIRWKDLASPQETYKTRDARFSSFLMPPSSWQWTIAVKTNATFLATLAHLIGHTECSKGKYKRSRSWQGMDVLLLGRASSLSLR